jgi:hypothetical protein
VSSVGVEFARNRSNIYLALGIVFLAVGIAIMWGTYSYAEVITKITHREDDSLKKLSFILRLIPAFG